MPYEILLKHNEINGAMKKIDGMKFFTFLNSSKSKPKDICLYEGLINRKLPNSMLEFYKQLNGFDIKIQFQDEPNDLYAVACGMLVGINSFLYGLNYIFTEKCSKKGEYHKNFLWISKDDPKLIQDLEENYFILEKCDRSVYCFTLFKFIENQEEPELYLYKYPHYFYPLKLTFTEYVELAFDVRMLMSWQDYFINREKTSPEALHHLDKERPYPFFRKIREIIPDIDLSRFPGSKEAEPLASFEVLAKEKDYNRRFEKRFQELEAKINNSQGNFQLRYRPEPLSINCIRKIETILKRKLPDSILAFYCQMKGLQLEWSYKDPAKYVADPGWYPNANFRLLGLDEVFGGYDYYQERNWHDKMHEGVVTMEDTFNEAELAFAKQCRLIVSEEFAKTVIRFVEGIEEPELYIIQRGTFYKLPLSFEKYMEKLLENMGMVDWQYFLLKPEDYTDDQLAVHPPTVRFIKDAFPEVDVSEYRKVVSNVEKEIYL